MVLLNPSSGIGWHVAITGRTQTSIDEAVNQLKELKKDHIIGIVANVRSYDHNGRP